LKVLSLQPLVLDINPKAFGGCCWILIFEAAPIATDTRTSDGHDRSVMATLFYLKMSPPLTRKQERLQNVTVIFWEKHNSREGGGEVGTRGGEGVCW